VCCTFVTSDGRGFSTNKISDIQPFCIRLWYPARRLLPSQNLHIPLFNAVLLDISVWLLCAAALSPFARLSMTHAATTYLAFHGWFISGRAIAILNGATTLFASRGATPVSINEVSRAVLLADLALVTMTCAWVLAAHRTAQLETKRALLNPRMLSVGIIRRVSAVAIPLGCIAMLLWSALPGVPPHRMAGAWAESNWAVIAQTWAGLGLLALIYWDGFKLGLTIPLAAYFALVIYQGNFRFRLLIPLILLAQIYVDRRRRRWPTLAGIALLLSCGLLFFPLKRIGQQLQAGEDSREIWQSTGREIGDAFHGDHPDEMILDEFASSLTLADQYGKSYWGSTYVGLLTMAIPRQWWPEKPGLADFEAEISTPASPMAASGMVVTMIGEFYLNFSYVGVVVLCFTVAYVSGICFHAVYRRGYFTLARFTYVLIACTFIQVFRDGLISLFVFPIINMMPLAVIVVLHLVQPAAKHTHSPRPILAALGVRPRDPIS
jgi:hypothetical protein